MFVHLLIALTFFIGSNDSKNQKMRIAGGHTVSISDYPYLVSIQSEYRSHICGGAIIAKDIVLTAAHCLLFDNYLMKDNLIVVSGTSSIATHGILHRMKFWIVHKRYEIIPTRPIGRGSGLANDIALIRVEPPFKFDNDTAPILLIGANETIVSGSMGIFSGWGSIPKKDEAKLPDTHAFDYPFRSVVMPILDDAACAKKIKKWTEDTPKPGQLCASAKGQGICDGDGGGPLVVNGRVVALASWGHDDCGSPLGQSFFTKVAYFRDWIDKNVKRLHNRNSAASVKLTELVIVVIFAHLLVVIFR